MITVRSHFQRGRRGFTLVELLCATVVMAIVMAATSIAVNTATQTYTGNQDQASVNQVARVLMDHIAREIRSTENVRLLSNGIELIYPAGSTVSSTIYGTYENQLHVQRFQADGSEINAVLLGSDQGFVITYFYANAYYQPVWIENAAGQVEAADPPRPRLVNVKLSFRLAGQTTVQTIDISSCPRMNQAE